MRIGVPKEIKNHEYRVGATPAVVRELANRGHQVLVEQGAGAAIGFADPLYLAAGAALAADAAEIFGQAELIVKVKEPQGGECLMLRPGQLLFTYLHLAPDPEQTRLLLASGCSAIAYETVTDRDGGLPLLAPMSEVAGRMAIQAGAHCLEMARGGRGTLLGGVPGVAPGKVAILGGGVVGSNAARMACGLGAEVTILDTSLRRLRDLDLLFQGRLRTAYATTEAIEAAVLEADLVVGAVLVPGATAPKLVDAKLVRRMPRGAVLVDVAIDQGGCFATSHPTTHQQPTFILHDVVHYCVTNMPGAVARSATLALTHATLPFILALADHGLDALRADPHLAAGLNIHRGRLTCPAVAKAQGRDWVPLTTALGA